MPGRGSAAAFGGSTAGSGSAIAIDAERGACSGALSGGNSDKSGLAAFILAFFTGLGINQISLSLNCVSAGDRRRSSQGWCLSRHTPLDDSGVNQFKSEFLISKPGACSKSGPLTLQSQGESAVTGRYHDAQAPRCQAALRFVTWLESLALAYLKLNKPEIALESFLLAD